MRKTKIICTIGPACANEETLEQMCLAGMNVARLNFSHGTHEGHLEYINMIKKVREKLNLPVAIMLDTKGPEYRIRKFENDKVILKSGDDFTFTTDDVLGNQTRVSVNYEALAEELEPGDRILLNNGLLEFTVKNIDGHNINCVVNAGGELSNRKSMSFPGKVLKQTFLSEQDKSDILFGIENGIDFIACSFVSVRQDLIDIKNFISEHGGEGVSLIAKIENRSGIDNIEEICKECDGIMIGRGDLGVEIPFEELPAIQKQIITECRLLGKRVITATEMLESMIHEKRPTRAEISDVANAVYDGTSAIMLSAETASGQYPVLTVETMARIAKKTEESIDYRTHFSASDFKIRNSMDAISHAACSLSNDLNAQAIVVCSLSGKTARMVSRFRSPIDIMGLCVDQKVYRQLALSWGVTPVMCERYPSVDVLFYTAKKLTKEKFGLNEGDKIVITGGATNGTSGNTDMIKVEII